MANSEKLYQFKTGLKKGISEYSEDVQMVNQFVVPTPEARSEAMMMPIPGSETVTTFTPDLGSGCRDLWVSSTGPTGTSTVYGVFGNTLFRYNKNGSKTRIGTVGNSSSKCTFAENQDQTITNNFGYVCDGRTVYQWNLKAENPILEEVAQIPRVNGNLNEPGIVSYITYNTYRLVLTMSNSNQWYFSDINSNFVPNSSFESTESMPDKTIRVISHANNLWAFSSYSLDIFSYTSQVYNPFDVTPGSSSKIGCASGDSIASIDDYLFWHGQSLGGSDSSVYMASSSGGIKKITTDGQENIIRSWKYKNYTKGFAFSDRGLTFYVLTSKQDDETLVYCVETNMWHQRSTSTDGKVHYWDFANAVGAYGETFFATNNSNKLVKLNYTNIVDHSGLPITRFWQSPIFIANLDYFKLVQLKIDIDTGTSTSYFIDPEVYTQFSWDGGRGGWGDRIMESLGSMGEYSRQVSICGLGAGRNLVMRLGTSAPIPISFYQLRLTVQKAGRT